MIMDDHPIPDYVVIVNIDYIVLLFVLICRHFYVLFFFFSSRRRHTRLQGDWSSDVCSSDLCGELTVLSEDVEVDSSESVRLSAATYGHDSLVTRIRVRNEGTGRLSVQWASDRKSVV